MALFQRQQMVTLHRLPTQNQTGHLIQQQMAQLLPVPHHIMVMRTKN